MRSRKAAEMGSRPLATSSPVSTTSKANLTHREHSGRRPSWRHKDSSEKTPSTVASDDEAYVTPAVPIVAEPESPPKLTESPSSSMFQAATPDMTVPYIPDLPEPILNDTDAATRDDSLGSDAPAGNGTCITSPYSIISPPLSVIVQRRRRKLQQEQERQAQQEAHQHRHLSKDQHEDALLLLSSTAPPVLAPLKPRYRPPQRRPTPPGIPSFEASQRSLESRLALRRMGLGASVAACRSGGGSANRHTTNSGSGSRGLYSSTTGLRSSFSLWRRSSGAPPVQPSAGSRFGPSLGHGGDMAHGSNGGRRRGGGGGGSSAGLGGFFGARGTRTHRTRIMSACSGVQLRPLPPVWRPPVSQHTLGSHPLARNPVPPSSGLVQAPARPQLQSCQGGQVSCTNSGGGSTAAVSQEAQASIVTGTAQTAAGIEARVGCPARQVTLNDPAFSQGTYDHPDPPDRPPAPATSPTTMIGTLTPTPATPSSLNAPMAPPINTAAAAVTRHREPRAGGKTPMAEYCSCLRWWMPT